MHEVAFYEVAAHEREWLDEARLPGAEVRRCAARLDAATAEQAEDAEVVSVFVYSRLTPAVLDRLPKLRLVATRSTGFDHIDLAACRARGVAVANVPSYGANSVAEHAFALLLALARHLPTAVRKASALDFSLAGLEGTDLMGKTFGVVGAGRIGQHALRIARGFGMDTLAYDPHELPGVAERVGFRYVAFDELLARADVISIHAALSPGTHHLFDRAAFAKLRPGALLLNTARGPIVDSEALCEALEQGRLGGAGLDVFEGEELLKDDRRLLHGPVTEEELRRLAFCHVLLRHPNVLLTPHSAFFTREGVGRLIDTTLENIRAFLAGRPRNLVSPAEQA